VLVFGDDDIRYQPRRGLAPGLSAGDLSVAWIFSVRNAGNRPDASGRRFAGWTITNAVVHHDHKARSEAQKTRSEVGRAGELTVRCGVTVGVSWLER
jgi:hypothetical protein